MTAQYELTKISPPYWREVSRDEFFELLNGYTLPTIHQQSVLLQNFMYYDRSWKSVAFKSKCNSVTEYWIRNKGAAK